MGLKLNISGLRFRGTDGKLGVADQLRILQRRLSNSGAPRLREGDNPADLASILSQRRPLNLRISPLETGEISEIEAMAGRSRIEVPDMIDDSRLTFKVARGILRGSLSIGRAHAKEINEQNPGHKLRIPTESELLKLNELLGNQLEGTNYWIWTETERENQFILRRLGSGDRRYSLPGDGYEDYAVRFVEDI